MAAGRALPLLMVCETARGRRNFRAAAGTLPMLTTTLERALAGPVTGAVTVWSREGFRRCCTAGDIGKGEGPGEVLFAGLSAFQAV